MVAMLGLLVALLIGALAWLRIAVKVIEVVLNVLPCAGFVQKYLGDKKVKGAMDVITAVTTGVEDYRKAIKPDPVLGAMPDVRVGKPLHETIKDAALAIPGAQDKLEKILIDLGFSKRK